MAVNDWLRDTHPAAPHTGCVAPSGNVVPDEEEAEAKPLWRPCPKCGAKGEGFRLINLRWGSNQSCRPCKEEIKSSAERAARRMGGYDSQWAKSQGDRASEAFLKAHGVRISKKGYMR